MPNAWPDRRRSHERSAVPGAAAWHGQFHRPGPQWRHRLRRQHVGLGVEISGPPGRFADHRRRQLRRQPLGRRRLHRSRRDGATLLHRPQRRHLYALRDDARRRAAPGALDLRRARRPLRERDEHRRSTATGRPQRRLVHASTRTRPFIVVFDMGRFHDRATRRVLKPSVSAGGTAPPALRTDAGAITFAALAIAVRTTLDLA